MSKITLFFIGIMLGPVSERPGERRPSDEPETTGRATAGGLSNCWWQGDLDGSTSDRNLRDFAVFQRCVGLIVPTQSCSPEEFQASDLRTDGVIDLRDYAALAALGWPPPMTINCGLDTFFWIDRCGSDCLPDGEAVETSEPVVSQSDPLFNSSQRTIKVARDAETLAAFVDPALLGNVDFESHEVIIFTTLVAAENGCWGTVHCYNGLVDMADGRRAAIVGFVQHGPAVCLILPWSVTRAVVAPRSDRPVVLLFIEWDGHVTQTVSRICG